MSQSRSTSPTPITFSALTSPVSTTPVQLPSPSELTLSKESQSPQFTATYPLTHATQSNPLDSRDLDSPMARQLRIQQTIASPSREHSTLSYSQDYVTSISKGSKGKRPSEPPGPSPKKKRTRTLTTPHQAAVLHALLAKSRFPNATVREEVGKSIGLSARKVQVWFQNQRQKARRPQSRSNMSHRLPDNFGTFPSGSESFPLPPGPSSSYSASTSHRAEMGRSVAREYRTFALSSDWGESSFQLSGPGMPGSQSSSDLTYCGQHSSPSRPGTAYEGFIRDSDLRNRSVRSPSPVLLYLPPPVPSSASANRSYEYDPSRILPPLVFPPPIPRPTLSAPASSGAAFDPLHQAERRSLTPVDIISYQPPESAASVTWPHPSVIHPQLQQPASFESAYQSSRSPPPWAVHDHGTASKSVIPPVLDTEKPPSSDVTAAAVRPPERSRRYDPIRGTFIYSSPPEEH